MKTLDWINNDIIPNNLICEEIDKIREAKSKKQIFDVCCSAKGIDFLPMMRAKGHALPYFTIVEEFGKYINGKYKPYIKRNGRQYGYTSSIYCIYDYDEDVIVDTTLCCFLGCENEVYISDNNVARIVIDENCKLKIHCPNTSRLILEYWGDESSFEIINGGDRVMIQKMNKNGETEG